MIFFGDLEFFVILVMAIIPAIVIGVLEKPLRYYRVVISTIIICRIIGQDIRSFLFLLIFLIMQFLLLKLYLKVRLNQGQDRKVWVYRIYLMVSVLPLFFCKLSEITDLSIFQFLGISYLTFRIVQIIIEIYDGVVIEIKTLDYFDFMLLFATFSSGPIDRSRRYIQDSSCIMKREKYLELLGDGLQKILIGIGYKFVLSTIVFQVVEKLAYQYNPLQILGYSYSYGIYMFFDFAGYSLMAIGTSYIFGIKVPDNFNKPFISLDMKDFWNRWHMTLSFWFRDFVFSRIMMLFIKRKYFSSKLIGASIAFIINMALMGLWHGFAWKYILYGLYHGTLLALTEIYQKKSRFHKMNKKAKWYKSISWLITINLIMEVC